MKLSDLLTTAVYIFSKRKTPPIKPTWVYDFREKTIEDVKRDFEPHLSWYWDTIGFGVDRSWDLITMSERGLHLNTQRFGPKEFFLGNDWTPKTKMYTHYTSMITTDGHKTFNLRKPGHLVVIAEVTNDKANRAIWTLHKDDKTIMPEFDLQETDSGSVFFSLHDGVDYAHKETFTITRLLGRYPGMRRVELIWDGQGLYEWYFDGVLVKRWNKFLTRAIDFYLIISLGIVRDDIMNEPSFIVEQIQYEGE